MRWKDILKDYLSFSKKDRIGVLFLVILIISIYLLPRFVSVRNSSLVHPDSALLAAIDTLKSAENRKVSIHDHYEPTQPENEDEHTAARFPFDPNTLNSEGWMRLGLSSKTAGTIQNYLSKGGHFNKPEDLSKIWGLPHGFYESVKDYIIIKSEPKESTGYASYTPSQNHLRITSTVNINEGDSSAFEALPGIGGKLAMRIAGFREKLGGFYSIEQVGETYGLPDSTFQKIKPRLSISGEVKKIHINTATKDELKNHPYIRWKLANAIVEYRNQHGLYKSIDDLKKIVLIDENTFEKLRPYIGL